MKCEFNKSLDRLHIRELGNIKFIGWESKVRLVNRSVLISINKSVVLGTGICKGKSLFSYLVEDDDNRPLMITYLDGRPRFKVHEDVNK